MPGIDHGHAGLGNQIASEWTKLRSVRSTWICLAVVVAAGIGLSALVTDIEAGRWIFLGYERAQFDPVRFSQTGLFISQFVVGVLGALIVTSEYATGSIRTTLSSIPRRPTVLAAKLIVIGAVVFVVGELTAFASFFVGEAVLLAHGGKPLPPGSSIFSEIMSSTIPVVDITARGATLAVILSGVYLLLLALFACGLGFALRHTAGAISAYVGVLLVLPLVVNILPSSFSAPFERYLPSNLGLAMIVVTSRTTGSDGVLVAQGVLLAPLAAAGLLAVYTAVVVAIGGIVLSRRDA